MEAASKMTMSKKRIAKRSAGRPPLSLVSAVNTTILDAASKKFLSKGFAATTMRQIAEEASVSPQTLYARYSDKTQLFQALMEARTTSLLGAMAVRFHEDAPPQEALQSFGLSLLSTFLSTDLQRLHQMVIGEANTFPELARTFFAAGPDRGRRLLIAYLKKSVASGDLHIDQIEIAAEQFIGSLVGSIIIQSTLAQQPRLATQQEITNWVSFAVRTFLGAYGTEGRH
jgi:TetR/AcrR family transcriptional repressor of mexJK operon